MKKNRMETSKKIILVSGIIFVAAVVYSMISCTIAMADGTYVDWTSIVTLLTVTGGAFGTACGFYFNKAKSENNYKLRMAFLREKYAILKEIGALDVHRAKLELENEIDTIDNRLIEEEQQISGENFDTTTYQNDSSII